MNLSKDQLNAKQTILDWIKSPTRSSYLTLGGYAGTGKTSLIAEVRKHLPRNWRVAFCAYTGKASGVMKGKLIDSGAIRIDDYVGTIHSLCYRCRQDPETKLNVFERVSYLDYNLIIVDEASMVNQELFQDLRMYGIPILFVGDHGQLPPISSDNFNLMSNPVIRLEEVHRFGSDSTLLDLSIMARNGEDIPFKQFDDKVAKVNENDPLVNDFIINHLKDFSNGVCLCGTNNTRVDVNQLIRTNYGIVEDFDDKIPRVGDRVVCLRNNKSYAEPIYNGMLGRIASISDAKGIVPPELGEVYSMSVDVDDGFGYSGLVNKSPFGQMKYSSDGKEFITIKELMKLKSKLTISERKMIRKIGKKKLYFDSFDFGYCLTVHKAQGSEWGNVMLFEEISGFWDEDYRSKWLYTAITRSNNRLLIVA